MNHSKVALRKSLLAHRKSLSLENWRFKNEKICLNLRSNPKFIEANTILAYFSFRKEPDLSSLFNNFNSFNNSGDNLLPNKKWGFPRCIGKSLSWHSWQQGDDLMKGAYGIQEPTPDSPIISPDEVDLILVPAVACCHQGYRLGYGGGFYDRFLSMDAWKSIPTIGIVFDFAYLPELPVEPWDIKLDAVCTDIKLINY